MTITLYDLAGANEDIFYSPYCWRTRLALLHKGLSFDTTVVRLVDVREILGGGHKTIPILTDGDEVIVDSWAIAKYLDRTYSYLPPLFADPATQALTAFINSWTSSVLLLGIADLIIGDMADIMKPEDREYFRRTREAYFGQKLQDVQAGRDDRLEGFRAILTPLRETLKDHPFLSGSEPMYADYIVIGAFISAAASSSYPLLAENDPVYEWRERCFDLYDGAARKVLPGT